MINLFILIGLLAYPVLEVTLVYQLAQRTSWSTYFLFVVVSAFVGLVVSRFQAKYLARDIAQDLKSGRAPQHSVTEIILTTAAGILLFLPGVITDVIGLLLFIPPIRRLVAINLGDYIQRQKGFVSSWQTYRPNGSNKDVIDIQVMGDKEDDNSLPAKRAE